MRAPAFLLYASDWLGSADLRRLDHRLKGVFIDLMCLAHGSDEPGMLRWPLAEIARAIGCKAADLRALAAAGFLRGDDKVLAVSYTYTPHSGRRAGPTVTLVAAQPGPIWFIGRMVRDAHVRRQRGDTTRFATPPPAPEPPPKASPTPSPKADIDEPEDDGYPSQAIPNKEEAGLDDEDNEIRAAADASPPEIPLGWREQAAEARAAVGLHALDEPALLRLWAKFHDEKLNPSRYARESVQRWREWAERERPSQTDLDEFGSAEPGSSSGKSTEEAKQWIDEHRPLNADEKARADEARREVMARLGRPVSATVPEGRE